MDLKSFKKEFDSAWSELKGLLDQQDDERKKLGETTAETVKAIEKAEGRITEVSEGMKELQKRADELELKLNRPGYASGGQEGKSLGQQFVESEEYKEFIGSKARSSKNFEVPDFFKADLTGESLGDTPGYLYVPQRVADIISPQTRQMRMRDLFSVNNTTVGAIEFVRETGWTGDPTHDNVHANVRAEAQAEASAKKESALDFEIISTSIKTIAHWLPVTNQILSDAPQLRSYIDNRLLYGVMIEEDRQLLYGDGTGANLTGIFNTTDTQSYDWSAGEVGDTKIDAIRRAITLAQLAEYPVTGVVLNPQDWEDIQLEKGSEGHYIWYQIQAGNGVSQIWNVPVVVTTAIDSGEFLLGAFDLGAAIWDRQQSSIRVSDSHSDFFTRNMQAILAEERIALTVYRPEAFVTGTFDAEPTA